MYLKYLRLKSCPRCHGDILVDKAMEDVEEVCIQCGYRKFGMTRRERHPQSELEKMVTKVDMVAGKNTAMKR